jgi:DNA-binding NtrC family response regulator
MFFQTATYDNLPPFKARYASDGGEDLMTLLILDDDFLVRESIRVGLQDQHRLLLAATYEEASEFLENEEIDAIITDINLGTPSHDGIQFLQLCKKKYPEKPVIVESGYRDVATVVKCIKLGADDYLEKPFDADTLQLKVNKVVGDSNRTRVYKRAFEKSKAVHPIVGKSDGIQRARRQVEEAQTMRILFYGETGVGKTPFAMYSNQVVNDLMGEVRPFEQLNCACLNNEQFVDQLFGHKKGAFTGAISDKRGLVELARGGDLFLDEIGEMPLETQAMFLTFLDSMEYYRLGDDTKRKAEVRVIAATNRDLKQLVEDGKFRKDLYSRLAQVMISIPALRDRSNDIQELVEHFVEKYAGYAKPYDAKIVELFERLPWEEGNVRELRDAVEFACLRSRGSDRIELSHLSETFRPITPLPIGESSHMQAVVSGAKTTEPASLDMIWKHGLEDYLGYFEKDVLEKCLKGFPGNLDEMAKKLKVSRPTLYRRLKKHQISSRNLESLN